MTDLPHTNPEQVHDIALIPAPRSGFTASGYGRKLPTGAMIRYVGPDGVRRWHRVYVMQYGNAGSPYILSAGREVFLDITTEHDIINAQVGYVLHGERPQDRKALQVQSQA